MITLDKKLVSANLHNLKETARRLRAGKLTATEKAANWDAQDVAEYLAWIGSEVTRVTEILTTL
jgi:hypothetical protein